MPYPIMEKWPQDGDIWTHPDGRIVYYDAGNDEWVELTVAETNTIDDWIIIGDATTTIGGMEGVTAATAITDIDASLGSTEIVFGDTDVDITDITGSISTSEIADGDILIFDAEIGDLTWEPATYISVPPVIMAHDKDVITFKKDGQIIIEGQVIFKEQPIFMKGGNQPMEYTLGSTLFIMVICIITVKWIMPHLTLRKMAKALVRLVLKPFQRAGRKVETEIDKAAEVVGDEWREASKDDEEPNTDPDKKPQPEQQYTVEAEPE